MPAALVGILNLTADSFSDGGRFLDESAALAHAESLLNDGADWIDVGAESSHPSGAPVPAEVERARLEPVVRHLKRWGARVSVDTHKAAVMDAVLAVGADMINDIMALGDPLAVPVLVSYPNIPVVIMFARNVGPRAETTTRPEAGGDLGDLIDTVASFFAARMRTLVDAGIARHRLVLDPGMGFFLSGDPRPSLSVLKHLSVLRRLDRPIFVSTSRKSFIGSVLGGRPVSARAAGTLATELWALARGADFVRTHDVRALRDAWTLWQAIDAAP